MTKRIILLLSTVYKLIQAVCKAEIKVATQVRWAERTPGGDSSFLEFLVLFVQAKRTKERTESPLE